MNRHLFIRLQWNNQSVIIPELMTSLRIEQDAPPTELNIIGIGLLYIPSYATRRTFILNDTQFWNDWIKKYIEPAWTPKQYVEWLTALRKSGEPARLVIESDYENYDTNCLVLINFADWEVRNGEEKDIHYSLVMYEFEPHEISVAQPPTVINNQQVIEPQPPPRSSEKPPPEAVYTVVSGDSLWKIAQKLVGDGSRWRELYNAAGNDAIIGSSPNRIFPGQRLNIPESWK